jgi:hypothetical protein
MRKKLKHLRQLVMNHKNHSPLVNDYSPICLVFTIYITDIDPYTCGPEYNESCTLRWWPWRQLESQRAILFIESAFN